MRVRSVEVEGFRNLETQKVLLGEGLNLFCGKNAQGKTNLLESIYLCCLGKSVRVEHDRDLIGWEKQNCVVRLNYDCKAGNRDIKMCLTKDKKSAYVNSMAIARIGQLLGYFNCIYFSPDEIRVITASPSERRRFMDVDLCQLDKGYYHALVRFNKILFQRNNLLKSAFDSDSARDMLSVWDAQLVKEGAILTYKRKKFIASVYPIAQQMHGALSGKENLELQYMQAVQGDTLEEITLNYTTKLSQCIEKDFAQRHTTIGCQRDDIRFAINGIDIRNFGSQGQQRTTALSLKLAELDVFFAQTGEYPVLLLDDVLSELDRSRQRALLRATDNVQIILTATKVESSLIKDLPATRFTLSCGKVK